MDISFEELKKLREATGAGMVDCKNALVEANGEIEKAVEILRKKGIAKAAKRGGREASEGVIKLEANSAGNEAYIVKVNSETDFVARNEKFQNFVTQLLNIIKEKKPSSLNDLENIRIENRTVKEVLDNLSGTTGEKMKIDKFDILSTGGTIAAYSHMNGKIGVLVALDKGGEEKLAHDVALQIAAASPKYVSPDEVPEAEIEKEKEIYREQLKKEGKPEAIVDKIIIGKIDKYFSEVCLVKQEYIKDDKKTVESILGDVKVEKFIRYSL